MNQFTKWLDSVVYPGSYQVGAGLVSLAIVIGLSHWHEGWLPVQVHEWLTAQSNPVKAVIYSAWCVVVFLITSFVTFWVVEKTKHSASSR